MGERTVDGQEQLFNHRPVALRHAHHAGDHGERQGTREVRHNIHVAVAADHVEQGFRALRDLLSEALNRPRPEQPDEALAQPAVAIAVQ
jgi:hypothetical protein